MKLFHASFVENLPWNPNAQGFFQSHSTAWRKRARGCEDKQYQQIFCWIQRVMTNGDKKARSKQASQGNPEMMRWRKWLYLLPVVTRLLHYSQRAGCNLLREKLGFDYWTCELHCEADSGGKGQPIPALLQSTSDSQVNLTNATNTSTFLKVLFQWRILPISPTLKYSLKIQAIQGSSLIRTREPGDKLPILRREVKECCSICLTTNR